ncbi:LLM class flavin-dependent oxidoreductase [Burkholderia vietnamiensis]|uniref:LLM class flavin-dependent oxidoreductase n=1 Tax=Burkholderia vietnamiensis TaxID=60552 RepID=UPI00264DB7B5|nr:LLM class flavin-dependent oxidoreductase [Burkholderia vietnamiensis]MDN7927557.1 LLM class flavin-dependent oxidoreductase [Burkholderia vietnamiensis]
MSYSLSLLDKSPIADGASAADALRFTTTLAQRAEQLGYERFWVAEHHGAPGLARYAVAAATRDEAERLIGALRIFKLQFAGGSSFNLASAQAAAEFARQSGASDYRIDELRPTVLADTPERIHRALDALSRRLDVDAFVIDSPVTDYAARLASTEWLGGAQSLSRAQPAVAAERAPSPDHNA